MADDTQLAPTPAQGTSSEAGAAPFNLKAEFGNLKASATDAARNAANTGVQRATTALDDVARFVEDAARQIDEKVPGVGQYARQASTAVNNLSASLKDKDVEDLLDDAKDLIRANPAVAVGAAAAVGFLLTRVLKLGADDGDADYRQSDND